MLPAPVSAMMRFCRALRQQRLSDRIVFLCARYG
jgi:hypothetical protein